MQRRLLELYVSPLASLWHFGGGVVYNKYITVTVQCPEWQADTSTSTDHFQYF